MLEEDDDFHNANIFMLPPEDPTRSDEDSGPEDDDGDVNNLTGNQLRAEAEATVTVSTYEQKRIGNLYEDESTEDDNELVSHCSSDKANEAVVLQTEVPKVKRARISTKDLPKARVLVQNDKPGRVNSRKKTISPERQWAKTDIREPELSWTAPERNTGAMDLSPASLFQLFFDDEVIEHMTDMSNLYASQHSKQLGVTSEEIRLVLAILLISGYVPLVNRRMFWESGEDTHNEAVSSALPLNRFEELLRFLHVCDNNNLDASDKMAKLRPLFDMLNKFMQHWPVEQNVSVDESMVPYYGRHSSKQFIRGKPIRFGFKVWCLNSRLGYLIQCEPYQGASGSYDANLGLGGSVVTSLMENLPTEVPFKLFVDNFFTSTRLLDHLSKRNISIVGTVRANRMGKCPLKPVEQLRKETRGSYDYSLDRKSGMLALRWNDNNVVSMLSNCYGIKPIGQVRRWSAAQKKHIFISQPHVVAQYNRYMGGTDRMDQNIAKLRINIRIKKWWWALFCFAIDVAVQNAWLLCRSSENAGQKPYTLVQFRREVAMTYILRYRNRSSAGRPSRGLRSPTSRRQKIQPEVRYDGLNHLIGRISGGQKRCAACGKKVQRKCIKCNTPLHVNCFERFHTK
jgi:Transposase IS4